MTTPKIRILMIIASTGPDVGGMEKQLALQANGLSETTDFEISVLAASCYQTLFKKSVHFIPINMARGRRNPYLLLQIVRLIGKNQPQIIHSHGHKASQILARIRPFLGRCICMATSHGTKKNNKALATMNTIFAVSQGVQAAIPYPSIVIHNAIEAYAGPTYTKENLCDLYQLDQNLPLAVAVGRLAPVKNFPLLMAAFASLKANLILFGEGPEEATLKKLERSNIKLGAHTPHAQGIMAAADTLIVSSDREGLSLSMLEALHMRTPVLSTDVSGAKEILPASCIISRSSVSNMRQDLEQKLGDLLHIEQELEPVFSTIKKTCNPNYLVGLLSKHYHLALAQQAPDKKESH